MASDVLTPKQLLGRHLVSRFLATFLVAFLAAGCSAARRSTGVDQSIFTVENRAQVERNVSASTVKCMKRKGFDYRPEKSSQGQPDEDYALMLDPRKLLRSYKTINPDAFGMDGSDVLELAQFSTASPSTEEIAERDALYGSTGLKVQTGCLEAAQKKYGDVSFEAFKDVFFDAHKTQLQALLRDSEFRNLDHRFVSCADAEGHQLSSMVALTPYRDKQIVNLVDKLRPSSIQEAGETLEKVLELDTKIVQAFQTCLAPIQIAALEITEKYLHDS